MIVAPTIFSTASKVTIWAIRLGIVALVIIIYFALPNFGQMTKAQLKEALKISQSDLNMAKKTNDDLNTTIVKMQEEHQKELVALREANIQKEDAIKNLNKLLVEKDRKQKSILEAYKKKMVVTDTTINIPIKEYNELSTTNINYLHDVYRTTSGNKVEDKTNLEEAAASKKNRSGVSK